MRQLARQSLQNSVCSGQHRDGLPIFQWGRGRQVMHLPCKQADVGALPPDSTISLRGTRLKHRAKPHKLRQAGVIPAPASNLGRCSGYRSVKPASKITVGSDDWSITSTSHHFGSVAQLAEQPVVCGKAEGANPFGSAILSECSSVFGAPGLGPGGRRWKSCRSDHLKIAAVVEYIRHPPSKRNDAGGSPAGSTN